MTIGTVCTNMAKYKNKKIETDDGTFDSKKEYERWLCLKTLEKQGKIRNLHRQVCYELIPPQYDLIERYGKRGNRISDKRICVERATNYYADFRYIDNETGNVVVEDVKSKATKTDVYKIKKKLMLYVHGIKIKEV